jgi:hypothetical protein
MCEFAKGGKFDISSRYGKICMYGIKVSGVGVVVRQLIYSSTMTVRKAEVVWCGVVVG